jgi:hypothetical protein
MPRNVVDSPMDFSQAASEIVFRILDQSLAKIETLPKL